MPSIYDVNPVNLKYTLMDIMPSASERIGADQAAFKQRAAEQAQLQEQQKAQGYLQGFNGNALQTQAAPAFGTMENSLQPQGQGPMAPQQVPGQPQFDNAYGAEGYLQAQKAVSAQKEAEIKSMDAQFAPVIKYALNPETFDSAALDKVADVWAKSPYSEARQYGEILRNISKDGQNYSTPTKIVDPAFAKKVYNEHPDYWNSLGKTTPEALMGSTIESKGRVGADGKITQVGVPRLVDDSKERLEAQKEQAKLDLEDKKEAARSAADDKKYAFELKRYEAQQRAADARQDRQDRRFEKQLNLREYNSSVQPARSAYNKMSMFSDMAGAFDKKIENNVSLVKRWMTDYVKEHPRAKNRSGAVLNDLINGKITGEGDLSKIKTAAESIGSELGKLEQGSYGSAGVTKNASDRFATLKTSAGFDNMLTQLNGITELAHSARSAQDAARDDARKEYDAVRVQYGLPPIGTSKGSLPPADAKKASTPEQDAMKQKWFDYGRTQPWGKDKEKFKSWYHNKLKSLGLEE